MSAQGKKIKMDLSTNKRSRSRTCGPRTRRQSARCQVRDIPSMKQPEMFGPWGPIFMNRAQFIDLHMD